MASAGDLFGKDVKTPYYFLVFQYHAVNDVAINLQTPLQKKFLTFGNDCLIFCKSRS
jgi:hypothetical protein